MVLGLVASVSPGNVLGIQILGPYPIPTELEMLEVGPKNVFSPVSQVMFPGSVFRRCKLMLEITGLKQLWRKCQ